MKKNRLNLVHSAPYDSHQLANSQSAMPHLFPATI